MMFDPLGLVAHLAHHEVRYVLIGGLAAVSLGSPVVTGDLDICYERSSDNFERLASALVELHATLRGAPADLPFRLDARTLAAGDAFTFSTDLGPLDVIGTPGGTGGYADLRARATVLDLGGHEVPVASIDDLIAMKEHAGRDKDRAALFHLRALKEETDRRARHDHG
jgi:hypothetical protein